MEMKMLIVGVFMMAMVVTLLFGDRIVGWLKRGGRDG